MTRGLRHEGAVHEGVDELVGLVAVRVRAALDRGAPVVAVLADEVRDAVCAQLGASAGAVRFLDLEPALALPAQHLVARRARAFAELAAAGPRPTVVGQYLPLHAAADPEWPVQVELGWELALAGLELDLLCAYAAQEDPAVLSAVRLVHPRLVTGGRSVVNPEHRDALELAAEHPAPPPPDLGPPTVERAFGPTDLGVVRKLVVEQARAAGLGEDPSDDLVLAVNEVVTNSVEHGAGHGVLRAWTRPGSVTCVVRDPGTLRTPLPGLVPPAPDGVRGRGVWLARQLCDAVHVWSDAEGTGVLLRSPAGR